MALVDMRRVEAGQLKLAIDVAGEHEGAGAQCIGDFMQHGEAGVRQGGAVEGEAVAVEAPGLPRVAAEGVGVGDRLEVDAGPAQGWIDTPEATRPAKVR